MLPPPFRQFFSSANIPSFPSRPTSRPSPIEQLPSRPTPPCVGNCRLSLPPSLSLSPRALHSRVYSIAANLGGGALERSGDSVPSIHPSIPTTACSFRKMVKERKGLLSDAFVLLSVSPVSPPLLRPTSSNVPRSVPRRPSPFHLPPVCIYPLESPSRPQPPSM